MNEPHEPLKELFREPEPGEEDTGGVLTDRTIDDGDTSDQQDD